MTKTFHTLIGVTLCFFLLGIDGAWGADGTEKWAFKTDGPVGASPAVGSDGIVYVTSKDGNLYAINPDGSKKWAFNFTSAGPIGASAAMGNDGTLYVGSAAGLYAINPDGTLKWHVFDVDGAVYSCPAIGADGTIYFGLADNNAMCAVHGDGTKKWCFSTGSAVGTSPAVGKDGTIYVQAVDNLFAVDANGNQKWVFQVSGEDSSPAVGPDGTIYVGSLLSLYAINPDGTKKWVFDTEGFGIQSSPTVGADGTVYILGGSDGNLYALNPDGSKKWAFKTGSGSPSSPAIGSGGVVYVGSGDKNIYAINPNGTQKWAFRTGDLVESSPAIVSDGTVYVGSNDNHLYAINGSSAGLAHTGWPMFHRDLRHTGFSGVSPSPDIKANGHDGTITVSSGTAVSVTVGLDTGSFSAATADWWVAESTPSGTFNHYKLSAGAMVPGLIPTHKGLLFDLDTTQLINSHELTPGTHIFYFGVDLNANGALDMDPMVFDWVTVTVTGP